MLGQRKSSGRVVSANHRALHVGHGRGAARREYSRRAEAAGFDVEREYTSTTRGRRWTCWRFEWLRDSADGEAVAFRGRLQGDYVRDGNRRPPPNAGRSVQP